MTDAAPRDTPAARKSAGSRSDSMLETFGKSLARQVGADMGRALRRGVLGGLFRGR